MEGRRNPDIDAFDLVSFAEQGALGLGKVFQEDSIGNDDPVLCRHMAHGLCAPLEILTLSSTQAEPARER